MSNAKPLTKEEEAMLRARDPDSTTGTGLVHRTLATLDEARARVARLTAERDDARRELRLAELQIEAERGGELLARRSAEAAEQRALKAEAERFTEAEVREAMVEMRSAGAEIGNLPQMIDAILQRIREGRWPVDG